MRKNRFLLALVTGLIFTVTTSESCGDGRPENTTALDEQAHTELNQRRLMHNQPPPDLDYSLERENITKRELLQNDRSVNFYMYVFIEGVGQPIGYYLINKVSSVNSQLTNTQQIVTQYIHGGYNTSTLPSPAEDGSYGENGNGVFGFTPQEVYIEHNMKYIVATAPLHFKEPVNELAVLTIDQYNKIHQTMNRLDDESKRNAEKYRKQYEKEAAQQQQQTQQ